MKKVFLFAAIAFAFAACGQKANNNEAAAEEAPAVEAVEDVTAEADTTIVEEVAEEVVAE